MYWFALHDIFGMKTHEHARESVII